MKRSPDQQIAALDSLMKHEGWRLIQQQMDAEIRLVTQQIAQTPSLQQDDLHWRRGVLFSAMQLLALPERLKAKIKNDAIIAKATAKATSPATAGQKGKLP